MIGLTRILIVEDRVLDAELAEREIRKILPQSSFKRVETRETFLQALENYQPDLVLSDYSLPIFNGMEAIRLAKEYSPLTPLIIWTGSVSEETAVECMKAGAVNYVLKENGKRLPSAIIHALEEKRINLERIANENKAKEIQRKLEATISAIPDLMFEVGLNGIFYDYHSPRYELLVAEPSQFIGKTIFEVLPLIPAEICNSAIWEAYQKGYSHGKQFQLKIPTGVKWFEISVSLRKELEGEIEPHFIILSRDITNRKEAEEELRRSKEELAKSNAFNISVFDSLSEHIVVLDADGNIIAENAAWKRFASENGSDSNDFIGVNYFDTFISSTTFSSDLKLQAVNEGIRSVLNGTAKEFDFEYPCDSPTERRWFFMHVSPRFGEEKGVVIAHTEITHRKLLEEQKEFERRDKEALINNTSDLIWSISKDLKLIAGNQSFIKRMRDSYGIDLKAGDSLPDSDRFSDILLPVWADLYSKALSGKSQRTEINIPASERFPNHWLELKINPIWNEKDIIGIACYGKDITDRKKQELEKEQLIRELTQNNNDLLQFSYIISHNLRGPLSNLLGLLSLLEDIEISNEYIRVIIDGFRTSTYSLNRTLNDLHEVLVIKRQPSISQEKIDIANVVGSILRKINNLVIESNPSIEIDFEKAPVVYFNRAYLESILLNLFTNSIRFRDTSRALKIAIHTELEESRVLLLFTDNGIGIDVKRYSDRLFGLYQKFHSHVEGKGFGLFLVKAQIESLGGNIEIESEVNIGTKLKIKFPEISNE